MTLLDITILYESEAPQTPVVEYGLAQRTVLEVSANWVLSYSIVAVSGLASHGLGSWKEPEGYKVWLRDFLPEDISGQIRVLTFSYDTQLLNSTNNSSITDLAKTFLACLKSMRNHLNVLLTAYLQNLKWNRFDSLIDATSTYHFDRTQSWGPCDKRGN